ncbi:MAG: sigma 54-interacting transcriptional regulator, partial [Polyangiaceae bacterium]
MPDDLPHGGTETDAKVAPILPVPTSTPRITVVSGPAPGRAFAMVSSMATVGRHPTNDLVVDDPRVSGVHLELRRVGDRVRVRDAGSTNGTWIGPHRAFEIDLAPGGEITIGGARLKLDVDDEAVPAKVSPAESCGELVGQSTVMRELFATLERIAPKDLAVLVQGETGTGKEEVARALHAKSRRASSPFVVVDATALPETLAESLLFGHEKGAFTGADHRRAGLFEAAQGGTVLIDEIGELPLAIQAKFLRVLERHEITRVGSTAAIKIDVRVISATHRDLRHEVEAGRFREDLFFRIAQVRVMLAPLRDHLEDVPVLCHKLLAQAAGSSSSPVGIEESALSHLRAQPWPGNVRELKNVLIRAAALASDAAMIRRVDVAGEGYGFRGTREERGALDLSGPFASAKEHAIGRFESAYLSALVKRCNGNLSLAGRQADVTRHHLRALLRKHGLYGAALVGEDERESSDEE